MEEYTDKRLDWVYNMDIQELERQRNIFFSIAVLAVKYLGGKMFAPMVDVMESEEGRYQLKVDSDKFGNIIATVKEKDEYGNLQEPTSDTQD